MDDAAKAAGPKKDGKMTWTHTEMGLVKRTWEFKNTLKIIK